MKCAEQVVKAQEITFFLITSIIIITVSTTTWLFNYPNQNPDWIQWNPDHSDSEVSPQTTTRMNGNGLCIYKDFFLSKFMPLLMVNHQDTERNLANISSQFLVSFHEHIQFDSGVYLPVISSEHKIIYLCYLNIKMNMLKWFTVLPLESDCNGITSNR